MQKELFGLVKSVVKFIILITKYAQLQLRVNLSVQGNVT